jgi:hypothetical protein
VTLHIGDTPEQIAAAGIAALVRELGPAGMARFLQQFDTGTGDYTRERQAWAESTTVDALVEEIRARRSESEK